MADVRGPSTRRLVLLVVLAGAGLLSALARALGGDNGPLVLLQVVAFGSILAIIAPQLWRRV
jgi:hypothetical protein